VRSKAIRFLALEDFSVTIGSSMSPVELNSLVKAFKSMASVNACGRLVVASFCLLPPRGEGGGGLDEIRSMTSCGMSKRRQQSIKKKTALLSKSMRLRNGRES
jgi:hypothetical protein